VSQTEEEAGLPAYEVAHSHETVTLLRDGGAARIELNRPESLNAWNEQFGRDLLAAVTSVSEDDSVRAVEIGGAGRAFSSGADLRAGSATTPDGHPDVRTRLHELYHPIILGLRRMPKPVVAAVNGPAVGIGCSLALASDLIVAARSAYFLLAFVNVGLVPDGGSSVFVPARAGVARAMQMSMLGERVPADQALAWGLINRVVEDADLTAEVGELVDRLAAGPTRSYAGTKRQINARVYAGIEEQLDLEAEIQQEQAATADFMEGVASFVERRPAAFQGR
jgi:2-(1,2-epoxy-1,2-dihydrophenyl)acetyl-CoA isomerase